MSIVLVVVWLCTMQVLRVLTPPGRDSCFSAGDWAWPLPSAVWAFSCARNPGSVWMDIQLYLYGHTSWAYLSSFFHRRRWPTMYLNSSILAISYRLQLHRNNPDKSLLTQFWHAQLEARWERALLQIWTVFLSPVCFGENGNGQSSETDRPVSQSPLVPSIKPRPFVVSYCCTVGVQ